MKEYYGFANFANVLNDLNELWVLIKDNKDKKGNRDNKGNNNEKLIGVCGWACPKKEEFLKILKYLNSIHHISPDISFTKSNFAFIKTMFILPKYHNRGLGKFLLKFIENRLIIQNIKYALLKSSLNAITFYQNNKYFLLEKIRDNDYGDTILMFKNLNLERKQ
ncbi:MAG: GNAT family N-acetyltransferase [Promethearchaeota archaeon]